MTEVEYNMTGYFANELKAYVKDTGNTLRKADTPHAPKLDSKTFEANLEQTGELTQRQCASRGDEVAHKAS